MKIPFEVKVGNLEYKVKEVSKEQMGRDDLWGDIDHAKLKIRLSDDMAEGRKLETLWHEMLHCLENMGVRKFREGELDIMAQFIIQVLRDNEELRGKR